ncbi:Acyl-CoA N-acyltransferase [Abortiporus biennis]
MFTTERLILRAYREEDVDETLKMWNDLTIQQLTAIDHVVPRGPNQKQEVRSWFEKNRLHVILEDKASGSYVGFMAIEDQNPKNRDVLRWAIDYAFKGLNLHRLWLKSFGHNERAINVYKKLGFVEEGRLRKANWVDGRWVDVVIMSILDEEWWDSHKNE